MVLGNAGRFLYDTPRGKTFVRSESKMIGLQAEQSVCGWDSPVKVEMYIFTQDEHYKEYIKLDMWLQIMINHGPPNYPHQKYLHQKSNTY